MAKKRRFWRGVRRFFLALFLLVVAVAHYALFWPQTKIQIGHDTTRVTDPKYIDANGRVDYLRAFDDELSAGVTPENNAAVLLARAFGPESIDEDVRARILDRLGLADLPAEGDYFVPPDEFEWSPPEKAPATTSADAGPGALLDEGESDDEPPSLQSQLFEAQERLWTEQEYPAVAAWLEANEKPLALLVQASRRPRYYWPAVANGQPPMMGTVLPTLASMRGIRQSLPARATLRAGAGHIDGARSDLLAMRRLGALLMDQPILITQMVGAAVQVTALRAYVAIAASGKLSADQARAILSDIVQTQKKLDITPSIDRGERYVILDAIEALAAGEIGANEVTSGSRGASRLNAFHLLHLDWNKWLRFTNDLYDRTVAALNKPTVAERREALAAVEQMQAAWVGEGRATTVNLLTIGPTRTVGGRMGRLLWARFSKAGGVQDSYAVLQEMAVVWLALAGYRAEHGQYPDSLEALAPDWLAAAPADVLSEKPLVYKRIGDDAALYSVGPNGIDEGGQQLGGPDDVSLRKVPTPTSQPEAEVEGAAAPE